LGMAGWTVVRGFGLRDPCLVESPLYLGPWDEDRCAFAPIETINNRDATKKKKKKKKERKGYIGLDQAYPGLHASAPLSSSTFVNTTSL